MSKFCSGRGIRLRRYLLITLLGVLPACSAITLTIESVPSGAAVSDRERGYLGSTPTTVEVESGGRVDLRLTYEDRIPQTVQRSNVSRDDVLRVEFPEIVGTIRVQTDPPGSSVGFTDAQGQILKLQSLVTSMSGATVDPSNVIYRLPPRLFTDYDEDHWNLTVEVSQAGYEPERRRVRIDPYDDAQLSISLEPEMTGLQIETEPAGVEVYERTLGYLGFTPLDREYTWKELSKLATRDLKDISQVHFHLSLRKAGYRELEVVHPVYLRGGTAPLRVTMIPEGPIRIRIETYPSGAEVYERRLGFMGLSPVEKIFTQDELSLLGIYRDNAGNEFANFSLTMAKEGYRVMSQGVPVRLFSGLVPLTFTLEALEPPKLPQSDEE